MKARLLLTLAVVALCGCGKRALAYHEGKAHGEAQRNIAKKLGHFKAREIAEKVCGKLAEGKEAKKGTFYNKASETYWFPLAEKKAGCNPACVVHKDGSAKVNWRCTGFGGMGAERPVTEMPVELN